MSGDGPRAAPHRDGAAAVLGLTGASLGVLAGLIELTAGPSIRDWVGNKQDTTRLGLTTLLLSLVALASAGWLRRSGGRGAGRVAAALGLLIPAVVCFTTVGRLWYLPGALLLASGVLVLAGTGRAQFSAAFTEERWRIGLLCCCGAYLVFLGATALGIGGALGIAGGALVWAVAPLARRSRPLAWAALLAGTLPFAAVTWWSVITPLIALLAIALGAGVIRHARPAAAVRPQGVLA
jgi:hypothetical protein